MRDADVMPNPPLGQVGGRSVKHAQELITIRAANLDDTQRSRTWRRPRLVPMTGSPQRGPVGLAPMSRQPNSDP